ncbi:MAG TPA: 3-deoxy-D-manno-octulosonic acid transferase [Candidatus Binatia bacterium]
MKRRSVWYFLYNAVLLIGFVAALPLTPFVFLLGTRYRTGFLQRFAIYPRTAIAPISYGKPVWIHAASVGEVRAAGALVRALKAEAPARKLLVSTFTATGHRVAQQLPGVDAVIFLPLDFFWVVRIALTTIDPSAIVFIETEIWPNLLREAYQRGIPTLLLSGRLSAKALSRYQVWLPFFRRVLDHYTVVGMQSPEDAARILRLGAAEKKVSVVGSLKFASNGGYRQNVHSLRDGNRPLLVAGSSHRGEEEMLLKALASARLQFPELSLVLAPRHPERFDEVEKLLRNSPFAFHRKSQVTAEQYFDRDVLLLDTVGELPDFFAAGDIAFVGGSLVDVGGHNILEPARFEKPVLFGPHMSNFKNMAEEMKEKGAAIEVHSVDELARALISLLADADARLRMGLLAAQFTGANHEAFTRNLSLARRYL